MHHIKHIVSATLNIKYIQHLYFHSLYTGQRIKTFNILTIIGLILEFHVLRHTRPHLPINLLEMQETLAFSNFQSGWRDLNPRPLDPQSSALPNCATARRRRMATHKEYTTGGVFPKRSRGGVDSSPNAAWTPSSRPSSRSPGHAYR